MRQTVKFLSALLIAMMVAIPWGNAQNRMRGGHQSAIVANGNRPAHSTVVRKASVNYRSLPHWGAELDRRPAAAVRVRTGSINLLYRNGVYYKRHRNNYVVSRPPRGFMISVLPTGFRTIVVGNLCFYYYFGTFYDWVSDLNAYEVVDPPLGAIVDALPMGYEIRTVNGVEYYYFEGTYYAEVNAPELPGGIGYQVVQP